MSEKLKFTTLSILFNAFLGSFLGACVYVVIGDLSGWMDGINDSNK